MVAKNKAELISQNNLIYDESEQLIQKVRAVNQKVVTTDQILSFDSIVDEIETVSLTTPLGISLLVGDVTQFFIDCTGDVNFNFEIISTPGIKNGQTIRIQILKNANQTISFNSNLASGPDITKDVNNLIFVQMGGADGSPGEGIYGYVDAKSADDDITFWQQLSGAIAPRTITDEVRIGSVTDLGDYILQVTGDAIFEGGLDIEGFIFVKGIQINTSFGIHTANINSQNGINVINIETSGANARANMLSRFKFPSLPLDPTTAPIPTNGEVYYNTSINKFRGYQNGAWINLD